MGRVLFRFQRPWGKWASQWEHWQRERAAVARERRKRISHCLQSCGMSMALTRQTGRSKHFAYAHLAHNSRPVISVQHCIALVPGSRYSLLIPICLFGTYIFIFQSSRNISFRHTHIYQRSRISSVLVNCYATPKVTVASVLFRIIDLFAFHA